MGRINTAVSTVQFNDALRLSGVLNNSLLSFDKHVTNVVHVCTFHACELWHIAFAVSTVGNRLDYCNSLLNSMTVRNFDHLTVGKKHPGICLSQFP